jgi:hypothetical protein
MKCAKSLNKKINNVWGPWKFINYQNLWFVKIYWNFIFFSFSKFIYYFRKIKKKTALKIIMKFLWQLWRLMSDSENNTRCTEDHEIHLSTSEFKVASKSRHRALKIKKKKLKWAKASSHHYELHYYFNVRPTRNLCVCLRST